MNAVLLRRSPAFIYNINKARRFAWRCPQIPVWQSGELSMLIFDENKHEILDVCLENEQLGAAGVLGKIISIEWNCYDFDKKINKMLPNINKQHGLGSDMDMDDVCVYITPVIHRNSFDVIIYISISNGSNILIKKFSTELTVRERMLIVESILSQRYKISDFHYNYYSEQYSHWLVKSKNKPVMVQAVV